MDKDFSARIVSLQEVYQTTHSLAKKISLSSYNFNHIVAIARGGMLPARLLCDFLNIKRLSSIQIKHYESGAAKLEKAEVIDPIQSNIKSKKVLVVDDVNDTGKTLRTAVTHIEPFEPSLLKTAVLHEKSETIFEADYTAKKLPEWKWLIYQWAVSEDILHFLEDGNMLEADEKQAHRYLSDKYDLEINHQLLVKILQLQDNYFSSPQAAKP
ncbi:phosphoribosyltransferase [Fodinibius halophilus]|uniref:Phosphoribosyltransferase n=1 Tax=Fodinibius halophilus TaxID=1736908 RepID=A0A6M1T8X2_9BACT|nr:phosphoribosyltransferase [Fodinibius halophilus]NGP89885.1 phosphoribosyltransferase [Fodinibius halophilus]